IGRGSRYFDYMVPYNWAGLVQMLVFLAVAVLRALGVLPEPVGGIVALIALVAILHFQWFIARIGLEISATAAIGLVLMDLSLGVLINGLAGSIRGQRRLAFAILDPRQIEPVGRRRGAGLGAIAELEHARQIGLGPFAFADQLQAPHHVADLVMQERA